MTETRSDPPAAGARLLLIEDDQPQAEPILRGLEEEGYQVNLARDGKEGLAEALAGDYDALIVDWRLPKMDGHAVTQRLRHVGLETPILMLTALRDVDHRVAGLDAGADDYLTKPFSFEELLARLRAIRRRAEETANDAGHVQRTHLTAGQLTLDAARREARLEDHRLDLRTKELRLLELLMRRLGQVVTRTVIAEWVWGSAMEVTDNALDVTVSGIRGKISAAARKAGVKPGVSIETVRSVGYRLVKTNGE